MKKLCCIVAMLCVVFLSGIGTQAAQTEEINANILLELLVETEIFEVPEEGADIITTLPTGTPVFSIEPSQGEWIKISYQEFSGYVKLEKVKIYRSEELQAEFEQLASQNELLINELEYILIQKKQKTMWILTIVALVIAIFAVSIASAILQNVRSMEKQGKLVKGNRKRK